MTDHENVELLNRLFSEDRFAASLGIELTAWSGGTATAIATPGPEHCNFAGSVHGGYLFSAADVVASVASNSWGRVSVAVSIDIEYLSAAGTGRPLVFTANEAGCGRNLATYRVDVHHRDKLVAIATAVTFRTADWHGGPDAWTDHWRSAH